MCALPSRLRTWTARSAVRAAFDGPILLDGTWRLPTSKHFFSTVLPLEDCTPKSASPLAQPQECPSPSNEITVFEDESEEYYQGYSPVLPPVATPPATFPLSALSPSFSIPRNLDRLHDAPSAPAVRSAEHSVDIPHMVDTNIFEVGSKEYLETDNMLLDASLPSTSKPKATSRTGAPWSRSHRVMFQDTGLRGLVEVGDYERAENLRRELIEAGIHIKRHPIYATAALHAWETKPAEERTEHFYQWFSLIPSASLGRVRRGRNAVQLVRHKLFAQPDDLNTIACFGLVAARKGYANYLSINTLSHIARFAAPGVSSTYFDEVETSAIKFYTRFSKNTVKSSQWDTEKWHNMFIRGLCFAGYMDASVDRLSRILQRSQKIPISPFTWMVLLEMLTQANRMDLVKVVRDLRATTKTVVQTVDNATKPDAMLTAEAPSATFLVGLIGSYLESDNLLELYDLRREIMHPGARPDLWAMAQMKFYLDRKQYIVVLRQFTRFYLNVGVPLEAVRGHLQEGSPSSGRMHDTTHPSLPIVSSPTHTRGLTRWPSSHTLTLVWQALAHLAKDLHGLQTLYQSFLAYFDQHRPSTSWERPTVAPEGRLHNIRFQYPPVMSYDAAHFHIFIMAFARLADADTALQVLVDMQSRDIRPDVYNWTALAGHYVGQDDTARAERILERMENTLTDARAAPARSSEANHRTRTQEGPISRPAGWIPTPNLVTYTTILRGLIEQGNLQEARRMAERMEAAGYVPGTDERTDMVLRVLRKRESSPRVSWQSRSQQQS